MKPARIVLPALLGLALSACGSGSDGPPTGTVPPPVTASETTDPALGTASDTVDPSTTSPPSKTVADPADQYRPANGDGVYFFTPSRNIACGLDAATVGCQVFTTRVIPPGADCTGATMPRDRLSKGYLSSNGGPFTPSCFNQGVFFMVVPEQKTLQYGHSVTAGGMTCVSETRGVTCRRGERGFFVSAQSFERW
ncbi:hypothetical protein [Tsukamurella ocularis]|uniref:hypothetical protein n=1 Tax=Tsukamurella ocularis TaxID=1970234 RepID=UPI00216A34F4|nr:hypothetical protein [Tsukamurella ocularis]MCS3781388.1 hypothetical protein [Tsukamurella ocularis]MCS3787760.1 hypothetical protein [Tsukamurella ocularis]MCS3851054.1 hypothetical protein [Tsukamurella ocularis]